MMSEVFKILYRRLNPAQKQAVDSVEGAVMVIAGPGTGKTQTLILRIAHILLKTQVEPENILALTFTESAVYEIQKRLVSIINNAGYRVHINTFHGFCNDLIQHNPEYFVNLIASQSMTELEQVQVIEKVIKEGNFKLIKPFGDPTYYVKPALRAIDELKKEGVSPILFERAIDKQYKDFENIENRFHEKGPYKGIMKKEYSDLQRSIEKNRELATLYKNYQKQLLERKQYDFNDMLLEVIKALKSDKNLLMQLQEQYQYILVDEHQDTNAAQNTIVELLCSFYANPNLFVVGDEKQAIFRFQGASLENFLYFKNLYPQATLINLKENYRSTQTILDAAGSLISKNSKIILLLDKAPLQSQMQYPEKRIEVVALSSYFGEYYYIAKHIEKHIKSGISKQEIAILSRNNKDLEPMAEVLERCGIPYDIEADQNILQDFDIKKLILLFRVIHRFGEEEELVKAMHIDSFKIDPLDIYKLLQFSLEKKISLWDMLDEKDFENKLRLKTADNIQSFYQLLKKWKMQSENESFDNVFVHVLYESGLLKTILQKKHAVSILDKVRGIFERIKFELTRNHSFRLKDFIEYLELLKEHGLSIKRPAKIGYADGIRLMTVHKSKGLEFDYVYIINTFDGHWGNVRKRSNSFVLPWEYLTVKFDTVSKDQSNEDERRLFYVALTRARKEVMISYAAKSLDGGEQIPSQFISEIAKPHQIIIVPHEFEKSFSTHIYNLFKPVPLATPQQVSKKYLENKAFFAELFTHQGLSVSAFNNYLKCPWRYFFRNLIRLPDTKDKFMIFGTAIHQALNRFLVALHTHKKPTANFLITEFLTALAAKPLDQEEFKQLQEKGKKALDLFYQEEVSHWEKGLLGEVRIKGVKLADQIFLNGTIDMIEKTGVGSEVVVYDFKTGKPKSRNEIEGKTKGGSGDYKRQLVFYKILLDRYRGGTMNMKQGIIYFVEPNERGQLKKEPFDISHEEAVQLEEQIIRCAHEILNLSFWNSRCDDQACEYCTLRSYIER